MKYTAMLVCTAASLFLIGCGGGGGGGEVTTSVKVDLKGADWAAYSASEWREINISKLGSDKIFSFEPGSDGKYGVAIHCEGDGGELMMFQATKSELSYITNVCEEPGDMERYAVSGVVRERNASAISIGIGDYTLLRESFDKEYSYAMKGVRGGTTDLLVADIVTDTWDIPKFGIKRDINLDHNMSGLDINLTTDGVEGVPHDFNVSGGRGLAFFFSKNYSAVLSGWSDTNFWRWNALKSGTVKGDMYAFECFDDNESRAIFETVGALNDPGDRAYSLSDIAPFNMAVAWGTDIVLENLDYTPAQGSPDLKLYVVNLTQNTAGIDREIWISKGWLGTQTTYTMPDLSSVSGWNSDWNFASETIEWSGMAVMANKDLNDVSAKIEERLEYYFIGIEDLLMHWSLDKGTTELPVF
ncbi:hypothetical protein [Hydrogenimonas sp.]